MTAIKQEKADNVVVVTDSVLKSLGIINPITKILDENNIKYSIFDDIQQNPLSTQVDACGAFVLKKVQGLL